MKSRSWRVVNLKQRRVALVAVKGFEHALPRVLVDAVNYIVGMEIGLVQTETFSTGPN